MQAFDYIAPKNAGKIIKGASRVEQVKENMKASEIAPRLTD